MNLWQISLQEQPSEGVLSVKSDYSWTGCSLVSRFPTLCSSPEPTFPQRGGKRLSHLSNYETPSPKDLITSNRPITSYATLDLPTYFIDLTPFVPLLADGGPHNVSLDVVSAEANHTINDNWFVSGNIQVRAISWGLLALVHARPRSCHRHSLMIFFFWYPGASR